MIIRAKVATVLSEHEAAINAGTIRGVAVGDFARLVRRTTIFDPDDETNELGEVTTSIITLRVTSVTTTFCVASTFEPNRARGIFSGLGTFDLRYDPVETITGTVGTGGPDATFVAIGADVDITRPTPSGLPAIKAPPE